MEIDGSGSGGAYWKEDEIVVDREGVLHYTGAVPGLMKGYRRRVMFAYNSLEQSRERSKVAQRLIKGLHDEAWRVGADLASNGDQLKAPDGCKLILRCLQGIEKVNMIRKTEAFDAYFDKCHRKRGRAIDQFRRQHREAWADLGDLADGSAMSDDLQAYFLLKHVELGKED